MINEDLTKLMDTQVKELTAAFRKVRIAGLPSIPMTSNRQIVVNLPSISAVYFIRGSVLTWTGEDGGHVVSSRADLEFYRRNPSTKDRYVRTHARRATMYIGRASNLRSRWDYQTTIHGEIYIEHHRIRDVFNKLGKPRLHWLEMPVRYLAASELTLIRLHQPAWNSQKN
jgi:hypothetical protein